MLPIYTRNVPRNKLPKNIMREYVWYCIFIIIIKYKGTINKKNMLKIYFIYNNNILYTATYVIVGCSDYYCPGQMSSLPA